MNRTARNAAKMARRRIMQILDREIRNRAVRIAVAVAEVRRAEALQRTAA